MFCFWSLPFDSRLLALRLRRGMDQAKSATSRLFVTSAIETRDELEEVNTSVFIFVKYGLRAMRKSASCDERLLASATGRPLWLWRLRLLRADAARVRRFN